MKCGPLEEGMANHSSILAARTPWTVWIGKRDTTLGDKSPRLERVQYVFSSSHVQMWESGHKESWAPKNWCFWIVVLEKTFESHLDGKEIKPVSPKGNQPWTFTARTDAEAEAEAPILWPPDAKSQVTGKDSDARKDWRQKEKGTVENEIVR